ncbi:MAG: SDR family oxidoreductase [Pseudomonadota bacterium]
MDLSNSIALVTGASRGLGRAITLALSRAGAEVVAAARTAGGLEELDDTLRAEGRGVVLVPANLSKRGEAEKLGQAISDRWGRLDIWVHTAIQGASLAPVAVLDPKEMERCWTTNVVMAQALIAALDPPLRASEFARAVFFADSAVTAPHTAPYAVSKLAQLGLAEAWGRESASTTSIRVLTATPPPMATGLRAIFHPGEDRAALARAEDVAPKVIEALRSDHEGPLDLR